MKGKITVIALVVSSCLTVGSALAEDGTVHFRGEITDSTCTVDQGDAEQYVDLHKVGTSSLNGSVGKTTSPTAFEIKLRDCPAVFTTASAVFSGTEDSDSTGNLAIGSGNAPVNDTGNPSGDFTGIDASGAALPAASATGVAIQILNRSDNSVVELFKPSAATDISSGSATLKFLAQYISTKSVVTPGTGNADAQFTVTYAK
ncbi:MAG: fimbrial protein [Kluyvera sp.]|uniref:fimbrial protein n=1 Tax=Kluyvera sp. TaxID=1538228 RepID=UPI003F2BA8A8